MRQSPAMQNWNLASQASNRKLRSCIKGKHVKLGAYIKDIKYIKLGSYIEDIEYIKWDLASTTHSSKLDLEPTSNINQGSCIKDITKE